MTNSNRSTNNKATNSSNSKKAAKNATSPKKQRGSDKTKQPIGLASQVETIGDPLAEIFLVRRVHRVETIGDPIPEKLLVRRRRSSVINWRGPGLLISLVVMALCGAVMVGPEAVGPVWEAVHPIVQRLVPHLMKS